jgi:hypothetical protein
MRPPGRGKRSAGRKREYCRGAGPDQGASNSIEFVQLEMHDDLAVQAIEAALPPP